MIVYGKNVLIYDPVSIGKPPVWINGPKPKPNLKIIIEDDVIIHEMCVIVAPVLHDMKIGKGSIMCQSSSISHDVLLGENVIISPGARVAGLSNIKHNSILGMNSVVHQNSFFPEFSFLGACSMYKGSCMIPGLIWVGCPAKPIEVNYKGLKNLKDEILRQRVIYSAKTYLKKCKFNGIKR